ncbi:MAG: hypothetical protein AMJ81_11520, partial [Phycisphaerae bacterium SM23_33]
WINNGIKLLRDKGLYYNPKELALYATLGRIFHEKMGQYTDEMHMVYKRRWAEEMDWVVGAPPLTGETNDAIQAIRRIADAPKTLQDLQADPQLRPFLDKLAALQLQPDENFLRYYNRFSPDPLTGTLEPAPKGPAQGEEKIAELMSSEPFAAARAKVLAFARRKVLAEQYRMDPDWMLQLMVKYGPLDWRNVNSHAIYWATLGLHRSAGLALADIHPGAAEAKALAGGIEKLKLDEITRLNTERRVLHALKSLTRTGQLYVRRIVNPQKPEETFVELEWLPDWRFIEPTNQEYLAGGKALTGDPAQLGTEANALRDGHITYLEDVVVQSFFSGRTDMARQYLNEIKTRLKPTSALYQHEMPMREFVMERTRQLGMPSSELARVFWAGGLRIAYASILVGDPNAYRYYHDFARRAYYVYRGEIAHAPRLALPPFPVVERDFLETLMLRPEVVRMRLSLINKSQLYNAISDDLKRAIYPAVAEGLRAECAQENISFEAAFPPAPRPPPAAPPPAKGPGSPPGPS